MKFGVRPESIPDYLALVGDTADGIPGLPGWGAKSTGAILARYRHLEDIPNDDAEWDVPLRGSAKLAATLRERMSDAIPQELDDLAWRGAHRGAYEEMCDELGFGAIRRRPKRWLD